MAVHGWVTKVFSTEIRKLVTYRFDFWMQFTVAVFAHVSVAFFLWKAVFDYNNVTVMRGYTFHGLMLYYIMVPMVERMIFGAGLGMVAREIYDGSLTKYLIYPVSFFRYKYAQHVANSLIFIAQLFAALLIFRAIFGMPAESAMNAGSIAMGIAAIFFSGLLCFFINSSIELIAFWADNVWTLLVMVRFCVSLLGGVMIPLAFFPEKWEAVLKYLPFSYLASFPIQCIMGRITLIEWAEGLIITGAWAGVFMIIMSFMWDRGRYRYTGVGI